MKYELAVAAALAAISMTSLQTASASERAGQGAKLYGDAPRGEAIVTKWCAGCHSREPVADDRVPSFASLAANADHTDGVIRAFLMHPHRPMPPFELENQQIEDIIAYLHTLAPGRPRAP